jgi:hypothetical protein
MLHPPLEDRAMPTPDSAASDIISAATFLAGSILVYLGNLNSGFGTYAAEQQADVRESFQRRAFVGLAAFVAAITTVAAALASAWFDSNGLLTVSVVLLGVSFLGGIASVIMLVAEIG